MSVLAVVINWRRPTNVAKIVRALRPQVSRLLVFDNACSDVDFRLNGADETWTADVNLGCSCRLWPVLADYKHDYVLLHDDDLLPPVGYVASLKEAFASTFASVGPYGRRLDRGRYAYGDKAGLVDFTIQSYLVRRRDIYHVLAHRDEMYGVVGDLVGVHDDILLQTAIQRATGKAACVPSGLLRCDALPQDHAVCRRPGHKVERQQMVDAARRVGWRPM